MSAPPEGRDGSATVPPTEPGSGWRWLWDHIGRIAGFVLALFAFALLVLLASLGWPPAYGLIVLVVIGFVMIIVGGRIKGA